MWKSVKNTFFCEYQYLTFFLKSANFLRGFRIQFCLQILTLEVEKYSFKQKSENCFFWEKNAIFDQK